METDEAKCLFRFNPPLAPNPRKITFLRYHLHFKQICFAKLITEVEADSGLRVVALQTSSFMTQQYLGLELPVRAGISLLERICLWRASWKEHQKRLA
jgi:hypothetical protein